MFFIAGFGYQTVKNFGIQEKDICSHCHNSIERQLIQVTTWFTLFFIPLIPYRKQYLSTCPICKASRELERDELSRLTQQNVPGGTEDENHSNPYQGKTPTQVAFLKQMEELRKEKNSVS